jgi:flagellar biosynthesis/type III secretory pathway M-ring protein FliF/YscJ
MKMESMTPEFMSYRQRIEKDLQEKVQGSLDQFLGKGRSNVQVSVEMDFSQREQKATNSEVLQM